MSSPLAVRLGGIKDGDIESGQATEDKNVNTEDDNGYRDFLDDATEEFGRSPSAINIAAATIRIHADTDGVTTLDQVFSRADVFIADSDATVVIGSTEELSSDSAVVSVTTNEEDLATLQDSLLRRDFKVGVRGPVVDSLPEDFDLKLSVELTYEALE